MNSHLHSLSSTTEHQHPQLALYSIQPPPQLNAPPATAMRRCNSNKTKTPAQSSSSFESVSCLPSAYLDPGVDPASVDFRNFFAYIPNEVKHRKRTTRDQVKVLESIFDRNTKPDSTLRQRLATELHMSARGVQVWFQNRRAKEKSLGKKAVATKAAPSLSSSSSPNETTLKSAEDQNEDVSPSASSLPSSPEMSPAFNTRLSIPPETYSNSNSNSNNSSQNVSPEIPSYPIQQHPGPPQASPDLYNTRRGSLPTIIQPQPTMPHSAPGGRSPAVNILARRGSAERLGINPYARFLMARSRVGPYQPRPTSLRESHDQASLLLHHNQNDSVVRSHFDIAAMSAAATTPGGAPADHFEERSALLGLDAPSISSSPSSASVSSRPMLGHSTSMPHVFSGAHLPRRASMPMDSLTYPATYTSTLDNHVYAMSSRSIPSPIPGPLPCPDFSFGHPVDSPLASSPAPGEPSPKGANELNLAADYSQANLQNFSFGRRDDNDTEDDATEGSYDALSRFGSIASVAGSESSNTSAYYSDVGSCNELPPPAWYSNTRRGSYASSGQFLDLVSGLDLGHGRHESDEGDCPGGDFPSPSSTISPGNNLGNSSPGEYTTTSMQNLPISGSSELAHALQTTEDRKTWDGAYSGHAESSTITDSGSKSAAQYDIYTQSESSSSLNSSLNLPIMPEPHQKTIYQDSEDTNQNDHQYHNPHAHPSSSQTLSATATEGLYSNSRCYTPQYGQEILELHHAMEYQNSGYVNGTIDMADVTSVMENTLQAYLQYS